MSDPGCDKEVDNFFYRKNVEEIITIWINFSVHSVGPRFSSPPIFINVEFIQRIPPALQFFWKAAVTKDFNISRHGFIIWIALNSAFPAAIAYVGCVMWHMHLRKNGYNRCNLVYLFMAIYWTLVKLHGAFSYQQVAEVSFLLLERKKWDSNHLSG